MKMAAAHAIADCVSPGDLSQTNIIPSVFDPAVVRRVAAAVEKIALNNGLVRSLAPVSYLPHQPQPQTHLSAKAAETSRLAAMAAKPQSMATLTGIESEI